MSKVNINEVEGAVLAYLLWAIEGGTQHKSSASMWYFPRKKLSILKGNWRPWEIRSQAADLIDDHKLCVWHDNEGWHAGHYAESAADAVFVDGPTMEMAICRAAIARYFGVVAEVPKEILEID